jgi:hypothetical protein
MVWRRPVGGLGVAQWRPSSGSLVVRRWPRGGSNCLGGSLAVA